MKTSIRDISQNHRFFPRYKVSNALNYKKGVNQQTR